jgi:hypothetical protein
MERPPFFFMKILHILANRYNMSFTLEELSRLTTSVSNGAKFTIDIDAERKNQAELLDALIEMDYEGYIFLNFNTDESLITIKGLIKVNNTTFLN